MTREAEDTAQSYSWEEAHWV